MCKNVFLVGVLVFLMVSCASSSEMSGTLDQKKKLDNMVFYKSFEMIADWAQPQMTNAMNSVANSGLIPPGSAPGQISLIGNPNYLRVKGDSVSAFLPYYGERQMGGGYNTNQGASIKFDGIPRDFKITKRKRKKGYTATFDISDNTESYKVTLSLFPNLRGNIIVNSSQRFVIRYSGSIREIDDEIQDSVQKD
ncbi:MAG: DUF4251 domain-containing protein [Bacteroidota bacterium]